MIRRSPSEVYIKYLLLHPQQYKEEEVMEILRFAKLDGLGPWYLKRVKDSLHPPDPFHPFDRRHKPSRSFLLRTGLHWVFTPDEHGKRAFEILERPRLQEFVEAMLLCDAPALAIAGALTRRFDFTCSENAILRYKSFFWDVSLLDSTEIRALLDLRQIHLHAAKGFEDQAAALKNPLYRDSRRLAADLPFSPASALLVQMRAGLYPSRIDAGKLLEQTTNIISVRIYESALHDGRDAASKTLNYSLALTKVLEAREKIANPEDDIQEQLQKIVLRNDTAAIPTLRQLGGAHTSNVVASNITGTDAVPLQDPEVDEQDDEGFGEGGP